MEGGNKNKTRVRTGRDSGAEVEMTHNRPETVRDGEGRGGRGEDEKILKNDGRRGDRKINGDKISERKGEAES